MHSNFSIIAKHHHQHHQHSFSNSLPSPLHNPSTPPSKWPPTRRPPNSRPSRRKASRPHLPASPPRTRSPSSTRSLSTKTTSNSTSRTARVYPSFRAPPSPKILSSPSQSPAGVIWRFPLASRSSSKMATSSAPMSPPFRGSSPKPPLTPKCLSTGIMIELVGYDDENPLGLGD
ncbi:hypothetical protein QBC43DRAFT_303655 [Cladorrhinum sp. PSN259]|nr:hypothetical protein QBC43DRAFT_303655 [Cladorrhinum sp. PSN259]